MKMNHVEEVSQQFYFCYAWKEMESPYYFYLLNCSDQSLYAGICIDLDKRLATHNEGKGAKYTRARLPVKVVYSELLQNKSAALKREIEVKKWPRNKKMELIEGFIH